MFLWIRKIIIDVNVNLVLSVATVKYENIQVKDIEKYIKKAGFKSLGEFKELVNKPKANSKLLLIMGLFLLFIIYISMGYMLNLPKLDFLSHQHLLNYDFFY